MLPLKLFRDKADGVADLLNWSHLMDSGLVQGKDGSLIAGWFYRAPDIFSSTDAQRNWLSGRVNAALSRLGAGWASWVDAVRLSAPGYPGPPWATRSACAAWKATSTLTTTAASTCATSW